MPNKFESPAGWSPPGSQFQSRRIAGPTVLGTLTGLILTPAGVGFAAAGSGDLRFGVLFGEAAGRGTRTLELLIGSVLLLAVVVLAAFSPAVAIVGGLVWGVIPGVAQLIFPADTSRLIGELPLPSDSLVLDLQAWVAYGFALISGFMVLGAGLAGALRRR
ncbi:hypothetical protein [Nocardia stercoris]|uniref:Uncharacterized protein n=1 Tax=Nocardia stercoris TaxID=2483361 RepID=A0A3M2L773_9NOCA|nr:hypothetical protein [Nocardia stercoris]RMI32846.1 hypothetical protein EBN03_13055 [Nocardia stercoris]